MKRNLLAASLALFTAGSALAEGNVIIDVFDLQAIKDAGYEIPVKDPEDYMSEGVSGTVTFAESGSVVEFTNLFQTADGSITFGNPAHIATLTPGNGYIQSLEGMNSCYFSPDTQLTEENCWEVGQYTYSDTGMTVIPNGAAKYFFLSLGSYYTIEGLAVTWGEDPLVGVTQSPSIYSSSWNGTPSGTIINVDCYDDEATIHLTVSNSKGFEDTLTGHSHLSYTIEGEEGTEWTFRAYTSKEGMQDSEIVTETYTISQPTLEMPYVDYPSEDWGAKMPANGLITITNNNYVGTMYYTINNGAVRSTEEYELSLRAVGQPGDEFEMDIWIEAEGYEKSETYHLGVILSENVLNAPEITPSSGSVTEGSSITIIVDDRAVGVKYRLNEGEWMTDFVGWDKTYRLTLTESAVIEAISWAGIEEYASYVDSEPATADITVEKLADNEMALNAPLFGAGYMPTLYTADNMFGTFEYNGFSYDEANLIFTDAYADEGELEYNEWMRNTSGTQTIIGLKANLESGVIAIYLADEVIEPTIDMFDNDSNQEYILIGEAQMSSGNALEVSNDEWVDLSNSEIFGGHKYFFVRGYMAGVDTSLTSLLIRYGDTTAVQTVEGLTEGDARYFTIDGIEVNESNLSNGIYIRVLGSKAEKVVVR